MKRSEKLIGKTISSVVLMKDPQYDDEPYMRITCSDGSEVWIWGGSSFDYTGNSLDEYPCYVCIMKERPNVELVEVA